MTDEQALVYVDSVKEIIEAAERAEEEEKFREMLLERTLEQIVEREREQREQRAQELDLQNFIKSGKIFIITS